MTKKKCNNIFAEHTGTSRQSADSNLNLYKGEVKMFSEDLFI